MQKMNLDIMHRVIWPCGATVLHFIRLHLELVMFRVFSLNHAVGSYAIPKAY